MAITAQRIVRLVPEIYYEDDNDNDNDNPQPLRCLAKGVDSKFYGVPVELGGWQFRTRIDGRVDESKLRRIPYEVSREIVRLTWGDEGEVTIAGNE